MKGQRMFSYDAWAACDPLSVRRRTWANSEEEKRDMPQGARWRETVCRVGCEIALAEDDRFVRVETYNLTP
jgi:hypothetical protein